MADYAIHDTTLVDIAGSIRTAQGTTQKIDVSDYARRIRKIPVAATLDKTASGAVANFSDGVDGMPVTQGKFYFSPTETGTGDKTPSNQYTINGWTGLTAYRAGKNLCSGLTKGHTINANTGAITENANGAISDYIRVKNGTRYSLSGLADTIHSFVSYYRSDYSWISRSNGGNRTEILNFNPPTDAYYAVICQYTTGTDTGTIDDIDNCDIQLEVGTTASEFASYSAPTSYPVSWQDSVYGGYYDTTGEVVKTFVEVDLSDLTMLAWYDNACLLQLEKECASSPSVIFSGLCAGFPSMIAFGSDQGIGISGLLVQIVWDDFNNYTQEQWTAAITGIKLVYEVTSTNYTEVTANDLALEILDGVNNFYSSANGDTEIKYKIPDMIYKDTMKYVAGGNGNFNATDETMPTKAEVIPAYFFNSNIWIRNVSFANVIRVEQNAFQSSKVDSIDLPKCTEIKANAFGNCTSIRNKVNLPSCTIINMQAFLSCAIPKSNAPANVDLSSVQTIYNSAFYEAGCLTGANLNLPNCKTIGYRAFGASNTARKLDVGTINLPKIETIAAQAFWNTKATNVYIGDTCTTIGDSSHTSASVFQSSSAGSITNMYVYATTPPTVYGKVADNVNRITNLYVPADSLAAYQADSNWNIYNLQAIPT